MAGVGLNLEQPVVFIIVGVQLQEFLDLVPVKVAREFAVERPLIETVIFVVDFDFVKVVLEVKAEGVEVVDFVPGESRE